MKLVKRCNDPVIALLIILLALGVRFAFQKISCVIISTSIQKEDQTYPACIESPSILKGEEIFTAADKKS